MSKEITLTKSNFEQEVMKSAVPVLVDFWAPWCAPCRAIAPMLEQVAAEYEGKVRIGKINVDEEGELAMQYGVSGIPTLILFKGGKVDKQHTGALSKDQLVNSLLK
jgi:thioredoxin 1